MKAYKLVFILPWLPAAAVCTANTKSGAAALSETDWKQIAAAHEAAIQGFTEDQNGTFQARNPKQRWVASFNGKGFNLVPDHGNWSWGLRLTDYSGNNTTELSATLPASGVHCEKTRLEYRWTAGFTEWFVNDDRGLEHGWTFHHPPEGGGNLTLTFGINGSLSPVIGETEVKFQSDDGRIQLTYSGLKAWDADGIPLKVRFDGGATSSFSIVVDARYARFPVTVDPIAQQAYLKASNTGKGDHFGTSVAISGDTVAVCAPYEGGYHGGVNGNQDNDKSLDVGAVYVFKRNGTTWTQEAYIKQANPLDAGGFASAVALSGDTLAVASDRNKKVTIFERTSGTWQQKSVLTSPLKGAERYFGNLLAVEGNRLVTDCVGEELTGGTSKVYHVAAVFERDQDGVWSLAFWVNDKELFPQSLSVSGDVITIGNPSLNLPGRAGKEIYGAGGVAIFELNSGLWSKTASLTAPHPDGDDRFGDSVSVSGNLLIVGAPGEDSDSSGINGSQSNNRNKESGAAYVYSKQASAWVLDAYIKPSNNVRSHGFGGSVSISGTKALVGAREEDNWSTGVNGPQDVEFDDALEFPGHASGAAYLFSKDSGIWNQTAYLKASNTNQNDLFGESVGISGNHLVIGAPDEDSKHKGVNVLQTNVKHDFDSGAAYVFDLASAPTPEIWLSAPGGKMMITGDAIDFGDTTWLGSQSTRKLVIQNRGSAELNKIRFEFSGLDAAEFSISGDPGQTLAAGQKMTVPVVFAPAGTYDRHAMLEIFSNDSDEDPFLVELEGFGESRDPEIRVYQSPGIALTNGRSKTSFGTVKLGRTGNAKTYEIHNTGYSKLTGLRPVISGAASADFVILGMPASSIKPGDETRFRIAFKPSREGTRNAILTIPNNDGDENPFTVKLTGMGAK